LVGHRKAEKKQKEKISTQRTQRQSTEFTEKRKAAASEGGRYKG